MPQISQSAERLGSTDRTRSGVRSFSTATAILVLAVTWAVFAAIGNIIGYISLGQEKAEYLANHGASAVGRIEAKMPEQHRSVVYSYNADNVRYTGIGSATWSGRDYDQLAVGNDVAIVYDPDFPSTSFLGDPRSLATENSKTILWLTLIVPVVPLIVVGLAIFVFNKSRVAV